MLLRHSPASSHAINQRTLAGAGARNGRPAPHCCFAEPLILRAPDRRCCRARSRRERHWDTVLPGRVLRVHYEDVVDDLEASVRRILEFCGLAFLPGCVRYHQTARTISTASSEQVRQPIFRDGLVQWHNYLPWLGSLEQALGDALQRYRE
ncbi:MAG: sulfotransferase [Steroidobacteraceae bacterium]